jgi:hypothetical protein
MSDRRVKDVVMGRKIGPVKSHTRARRYPLAQVGAPVLGATLAAWLKGKYGRKVRIKVGDLEAEASTADEVQTLLRTAAELKAPSWRRSLRRRRSK